MDSLALEMGMKQSDVGYDMAHYLTKKLDKSFKEIVHNAALNNIIITTNKVAFAIYVYNKAILSLGITQDRAPRLSEILIWLDFVFLPSSPSVDVFKQNGEVHYIYVKDERDETYVD